MRPIRLEFKGLRSYRQTTVVDFSNLDLFAIIGDTGAGKSTIIEALSLALYGRKTWTGGANLEELIADGENTMAIELVFVADGHEWTVTRSRHRNASAPINKLECPATAEKYDGNKAVNERVESLLGLDHSQFVRAVVLPQGRFDELLQSTRTERNKILRSIFGLDDLRRVRDVAVRRRDTWQPVLAEAQARRDALSPDPAGALRTAQASAASARERADRLAAAVDELAGLQRRRLQIAEAASSLATAAGELDPSPRLVETLAGLVERADVLVAERDRLATIQTEAEAAQAAATAAHAETLAGFEHASAAARAAALVRTVAANLIELDVERSAADAALARLHRQQPADTEPEALVGAHQGARAAAVEAADLLAQARRHAAAAGEAWQRFVSATDNAAVARDQRTLAQGQADDARSAEAVARAALVSAQTELDAAKSAHRDAVRADAAAVAGRGLQPGDRCPVCTQPIPVDFDVGDSGDLEAAEVRVLTAEGSVVEMQRSVTTAETTAHLRSESLQRAAAVLDDALVAVGEARAAVAAIGLDRGAPTVEAALAPIQALVDAADERAERANDAAERARDERERASAARDAAMATHRAELASAQRARTQIDTRQASQLRQLRELPASWSPSWDRDAQPDSEALLDLADRIDAMVASLAEWSQRSSTAAEDLARARQAFAELRVQAVEQVNAPATTIVDSLNSQLRHADTVSNVLRSSALRASVSTSSDLLAAPVGSDTTDSLRPSEFAGSVRLDTVADLLDPARAVVEYLAPLARRAHDAAILLDGEQSELDATGASILEGAGAGDPTALAASAGAAGEQAERGAADIVALEAQVVTAGKLDALLGIGRPYVANLDVVAITLRDQHFVDHLVTAREVELLAEATRRLSAISDGRYGFVPDFGVVRIATGEIRSPDTLSGGERFQAALALALALVEIASRGAGKLDAVFVDEGFGSLDGAALDVALDTLGSVAGGGKLVALISHLRPVAEYVDTVFDVTKDDLFGSTITKLDAEARERLLADDIRSGLTR